MIGSRLKLARSAAGLSLRALAGRIGGRVTAQAIGKYERNESMPGSGVLIALAKALGASVEYLTSEQDLAFEAVEFRTRSIRSRREETMLQARVMDLLERYISVEQLLSMPSVRWDKPRDAPYPVVRDPSEVEQAAISLRTHWDLGRKPIVSFVELLEECGVKVLALELSDIRGSTACARRGGESVDVVIVVNCSDSAERQRFTFAHELGHLVLTVDDEVDSEKAAHRFAGAFLMPADSLRTEIGRRRTSIGWSELFNLKRVHGVSVQAIVCRCRDLGIINDALYRRLFRDISSFGWRTPPYPEPQPIEPERPSRLERLCVRALAENVISVARAAELLGRSVRTLQRFMDEPPRDQ